MKRKTFRILFFLRKGKLLKNREAPICIRITVDKRMCDIQIKRSIPIDQWNQSKECAKGKGRDAEELNNYISSAKVRFFQIHRELEKNGKEVTAERIKDIFYGKDESRKTLLQLFEEHNTQCRQLIGKDFVPKTVQRYETTARYLKEFMQRKYKMNDMLLTEVTPFFIQEFDIFPSDLMPMVIKGYCTLYSFSGGFCVSISFHPVL